MNNTIEIPSSVQEPTPLAERKKTKIKLTKEEKLALLKEKKAQKALQNLEEQKQSFRDHLQREIKYSKKSFERAAKDWENMFANMKYEELKIEMAEIWQFMNQCVDRRDQLLERLLEEFEIAEQQYQRNYSKHVQIIENLQKIHEHALEAAKKSYERNAEELVMDFLENTEYKNEYYAGVKKYYEDVLHATNLITKDILKRMKQNFYIRMEETIDSNIEKRYRYRDIVLHKMESMEQQTMETIEEMREDALNPNRQKLYIEYVRKQTINENEFVKLANEAKEADVLKTHLQKDLCHFESFSNQQISSLRSERAYLADLYWIVRHRQSQDLKHNKIQFQSLAAEIHKTISILKDLCKYGEQLLGFANCCQKLQTEKEKVVPWTEDFDPAHAIELSKQLRDGDEESDELENAKAMQLFWHRVSLAELHVYALKDEKHKLMEENQYLQSAIKSYCHMNAYNMAIASLGISEKPTVSIPIQEAAHIVHFQRRNLNK